MYYCTVLYCMLLSLIIENFLETCYRMFFSFQIYFGERVVVYCCCLLLLFIAVAVAVAVAVAFVANSSCTRRRIVTVLLQRCH